MSSSFEAHVKVRLAQIKDPNFRTKEVNRTAQSDIREGQGRARDKPIRSDPIQLDLS